MNDLAKAIAISPRARAEAAIDSQFTGRYSAATLTQRYGPFTYVATLHTPDGQRVFAVVRSASVEVHTAGRLIVEVQL